VTDVNIVSHLVKGALSEAGEGFIDVFNPASGLISSRVPVAGTGQVEAAIKAASEALPGWKKTPPAKRINILYRFVSLLEENEKEIIRLISSEHGKTYEDARGELRRGIENVIYACGAPELLKGEFSRDAGPGIDSWNDAEPLGVVVGITPFNFPAMVPLWMYPLAIACGNTFILKPSERTPSASLFIAKLFSDAGLPDGVLNVIHGNKITVDLLLNSPAVKAVSFVGSTPAAEAVYQQAAVKGIRAQALGGAKNHAVVMPDCHLENTVSALMGAAYGSCGERCMAISVAVCVGDEIADRLIDRLASEISTLTIGPWDDSRSEMGPLISQDHRRRVSGLIASGIEQGASLVSDGREHPLFSESGFFIGGSLFDRVTPDMRIYQEEIFGPVLCVVRVSSLDEALALINAHEYANGTCIFTRDGASARAFSTRVEVGMVGINVPLPVPVAYHSFGGWRRSLFGDLSAYGPDGVKFYTRRKTITQRWINDTAAEKAQFSFPSQND